MLHHSLTPCSFRPRNQAKVSTYLYLQTPPGRLNRDLFGVFAGDDVHFFKNVQSTSILRTGGYV